MMVRQAIEDLTLQTHENKQYKIRKGDVVLYYSQVSHFDSEMFPEPEVGIPYLLVSALDGGGHGAQLSGGSPLMV